MLKHMEWIKQHIMDVLIWGLIAFFTILYISLLFNYNIWTDEAFTLQLIHGNLTEIWQGTANDVHPPLYYFYAKLFYDITGQSLWVQKFITILPQVGTYVLVATVFRKRFGDMAAYLTLLFFTCIPCTMEFTVQVRMYSLALLFVTVCGMYAYEAYMEAKPLSWVLMSIGALGAAYTHYFAFVSVIVIVGILFLAIAVTKRKLLKQWILCAVAMIVLYLPWLPAFYAQVTRVRESYWIPEITPETIWSYFVWTYDLELLPGVVYGVLALLIAAGVLALIRLFQTRDGKEIAAFLGMLVPTATALLGVLISLSKSPIYRDQYIFPSLMLLAMFFGIAFRKLNWKYAALISAFFLFIGAVQYKECFRQEYRSTYVPQTMEFFEENLEEDDYIIYNWSTFRFIYENYFPTERLIYVEDFDFSGDFNNVWFLNTKNNPQVDPEQLKANGLSMDIIGLYGIEHNEFDLYMIWRDEY